MTGSKKIEFDADARSQERKESEITIGGKKFRPRAKTSRVMREWIEASPDPATFRQEAEDLTKEQMLEQQGMLHKQIAVLIEDEEGAAAEPDFLEEHLDVEDAGDLLGMLMPSGEQEAAAGNASGPAAG